MSAVLRVCGTRSVFSNPASPFPSVAIVTRTLGSPDRSQSDTPESAANKILAQILLNSFEGREHAFAGESNPADECGEGVLPLSAVVAELLGNRAFTQTVLPKLLQSPQLGALFPKLLQSPMLLQYMRESLQDDRLIQASISPLVANLPSLLSCLLPLTPRQSNSPSVQHSPSAPDVD